MPIIKLLDPTINKVYNTKGLGFARMKLVSVTKVSETERVYTLQGGNFTWIGNKGQFHQDFNGDTVAK